jgi:AraC-like DNA-binding protein
MDERLPLGCEAAFEHVHAEHLAVASPGIIPLRTCGEGLLLFSVHGAAIVETRRGEVVLRPNEAFLCPPARADLGIRSAAAAELYLLRFRQGRSRRGTPCLRLDVPDHVTVLRPGRLTSLLRRIIDEARLTVPSRPVLHHLVVLALCELARSSRAGEADGEREAILENIASRVDAFIAAHYHEPIGTLDIARELHYNPDYLERAYRSERRMPIREAIHARRIKEAAAQLLLQRSKGVAEIAALCGYADPGYFRRVFKRATHMTPHGWRLHNSSAHRRAVEVAAGVQG